MSSAIFPFQLISLPLVKPYTCISILIYVLVEVVLLYVIQVIFSLKEYCYRAPFFAGFLHQKVWHATC